MTWSSGSSNQIDSFLPTKKTKKTIVDAFLIKKQNQVLDAAVGVSLVDDPAASLYPMPLTATGKYDVEVSMRVWLGARCASVLCVALRVFDALMLVCDGKLSPISCWQFWNESLRLLVFIVTLALVRSVERGLAFRAQQWWWWCWWGGLGDTHELFLLLDAPTYEVSVWQSGWYLTAMSVRLSFVCVCVCVCLGRSCAGQRRVR